MENYEQFLRRIDEFEQPVFTLPNEYFSINPSLKYKVDIFNKFRPFYGDTVIFELSDEIKAQAGGMIDALYREAGDCFSERLKNDALHITLHDLSNSSNVSDIGEDMFRNEIILLKYAQSGKIGKSTIRFETNYCINMVGVTIVLALKPKTREDYENLIALYGIADCVRALPYPLTPHITLAYFKYEGFSADKAERLCRIVNRLNKTKLEIEVSTDKLFYEKFTDMNNYYKIFPLT